MTVRETFTVRAIALYRQGHVLGTYEIPTEVRARQANLEKVADDMLRRGAGWDFVRLTLSLDGWRVYTRWGEDVSWDESALRNLVPGTGSGP